MTPDKSDNPGQTLAVRDRIPGQDRTGHPPPIRVSVCPVVRKRGRCRLKGDRRNGTPAAPQNSRFCELIARPGQFAIAILAVSEA